MSDSFLTPPETVAHSPEMAPGIPCPDCMATVVIVAAGRGTRMGLSHNKVFEPVGGMPVLARTLQAFADSGVISRYIVVVGEQERRMAAELVSRHCPSLAPVFVQGGADRQASVLLGLQALEDHEAVVLVHDGARPFVTAQSIRACAQTAWQYGAACVGVPVKDTIKRVNGAGEVVETPERASLWQVQTPQGFKADLLLDAHRQASQSGYRGTDDASLVERMGVPVRMVMGSYGNIKLTTAEDLAFAEVLLGK